MYANGHMADNNIDKFCGYKSDENYSLFSLLSPVYFHFFIFYRKQLHILETEMPFKKDKKSGKVGRTFPDFDY